MVEAHVKPIFTKREVEGSPDDHRRALAMLAYLRATTEAALGAIAESSRRVVRAGSRALASRMRNVAGMLQHSRPSRRNRCKRAGFCSTERKDRCNDLSAAQTTRPAAASTTELAKRDALKS